MVTSIELKNLGAPAQEISTPKKVCVIPLPATQALKASDVQQTWDQRTIAKLDSAEVWLDRFSPNYDFQDRLDEIGTKLEEMLRPFGDLSRWLDSSEGCCILCRVACYLVKLPPRIARNIIRLLYNIVKCVAVAVTHPAKATVKLAKLLVLLAKELTKSQTWVKMGAAMAAGSAGQLLVTGNPFALIGILIGLGGLQIGIVWSLMEGKEDPIDVLKNMIDAAATGFVMGVTFAFLSPQQTLTPEEKGQYVEMIREDLGEVTYLGPRYEGWYSFENADTGYEGIFHTDVFADPKLFGMEPVFQQIPVVTLPNLKLED